MQSFVLVNLAKAVFVNVRLLQMFLPLGTETKFRIRQRQEEGLTKWFLFCNIFTGKTCKPKGMDGCGPESRGTTLLISGIIGPCSQVVGSDCEILQS